jgi:hypothetical protein
MRIYIDEDLAAALLGRLLQTAGARCRYPDGRGHARSFGRHSAHAWHSRDRVCLTANYDDYEELHLLVREARGTHAGIMVVRHDNDPTRDLTAKGVVAAIRTLEAAGVPIANEYIILNHWR